MKKFKDPKIEKKKIPFKSSPQLSPKKKNFKGAEDYFVDKIDKTYQLSRKLLLSPKNDAQKKLSTNSARSNDKRGYYHHQLQYI